MTFNTLGFSSPSMEGFTKSLLAVDEFGQWFLFAERLRRLGIEITENQRVPNGGPPLAAMGLFIRAHKSFQATISLLQLGLSNDARIIARSSAECALALFALAVRPQFMDELKEHKIATDAKKARILSEYREQMELSKQVFDALISREADFEIREKRKPRQLNWASVASQCRDENGDNASSFYNLIYRLLSEDGTHINLDAIFKIFDVDLKSKNIKGVRVGPELDSLFDTLAICCNIFLFSISQYDKILGLSAASSIANLISEFENLPNAAPSDIKLDTI